MKLGALHRPEHVPKAALQLRSSRGLSRAVALVCLSVVLTMAFFYRAVFTGEIFIARDILRVYLPLHAFWVSQVRSGHFPSWYPYDGLGQPYVGMMVSSALHPSNLLYLLLPLGAAMDVNILLCFPVAFLGMFILCRRWGVSSPGAIVAGVLFAFSGYMISITNNLPYLMAAATVPWVVWSTDRYLHEPSLLQCVVAGALGALLLFAGDSQSFIMAMCLLLPLTLMRNGGKSRLRALRLLSLVYLCTLVLCSPQLVAAHRVMEAGGPKLRSLDEAEIWSLNPLRLVGLLFGPILGRTHFTPVLEEITKKVFHDPMRTLWVDSVEIGIIGVSLAMTGLWRQRKKSQAWVLCALGCLILWMALGKYAGLYGVVFRYVPLWRPLRYPAKLIPYVIIIASIGAAFGVDAALETTERCKRIAALLLGLGVLILIGTALEAYGHLWSQAMAGSWTGMPSSNAMTALHENLESLLLSSGVAVVAFGLVLILPMRPILKSAALVSILFAASYVHNESMYLVAFPSFLREPSGFVTQVVRDPKVKLGGYRLSSPGAPLLFVGTSKLGRGNLAAAEFDTVMAADTPALWGIESLDGYLPATSGAFSKLLRRHRDWLFSHAGLYSVRYSVIVGSWRKYVSTLGVEVASRKVPMVFSKAFDVSLIRNGEPLPRAYLTRPECVKTHDEAVKRLTAPGFDGTKGAIVECLHPVVAASEDAALGKLNITQYGPDQVQITANTSGPALLVLNDSYYPGWSALIDGKPTQILRTNAAVRGVLVPPGIHRITFDYSDSALKWACLFSMGALLVGIGLAALTSWRRRRAHMTR